MKGKEQEAMKETETMNKTAQFFYRSGEPVYAKIETLKNGRPGAWITLVCPRCAGKGGWEGWRRTGWSCWRCGGKGNLGERLRPVYTRERLEELDARKAAKAPALAAKRQAAKDAREAAFWREHGELVERMEAHTEIFFLQSIAKQARFNSRLSERQIAAAREALAELEPAPAKPALSEREIETLRAANRRAMAELSQALSALCDDI